MVRRVDIEHDFTLLRSLWSVFRVLSVSNFGLTLPRTRSGTHSGSIDGSKLFWVVPCLRRMLLQGARATESISVARFELC